MLSHVRIVLINTSHPGNIGATARALKTMGLNRLYLVAPQQFPHPKANEMASGAADLLDQAVVVDTLEEAISDCNLVLGTSVRERTIPWPMLTPRALAEKAIQNNNQEIAILFGREQSGLTNEELHRCHFHVQIPSNPDYGSLNIAAAVQVIAYELRVASLGERVDEKAAWDYPYATALALENFYQHLEKVLIEIDFLNPAAPRQLMARLRRLFHRAGLDEMEVNILRGVLKAVEKKI